MQIITTPNMPSANGAKNAGLLAVQILSVKLPNLREQMKESKEEMKNEVIKKVERLS